MKKRVVTKALKDEFKFAYKAFLSKFDKPSLVVYREINGVLRIDWLLGIY